MKSSKNHKDVFDLFQKKGFINLESKGYYACRKLLTIMNKQIFIALSGEICTFITDQPSRYWQVPVIKANL